MSESSDVKVRLDHKIILEEMGRQSFAKIHFFTFNHIVTADEDVMNGMH